jgi:methyl-accepting chemotaxis protein
MSQETVGGSQPVSSKYKFTSLRLKLLLGFTVLFSAVFAAAFYWFYSFTTQKTMNRLFSDMEDTALGTAKKIDVEELVELYKDGQASTTPDRLTDDPRYKHQLAWFRTIHSIEPRAWPYTFVVVDDRDMGNQLQSGNIMASRDRPPIATPEAVRALTPGETLSTVFLADLWVYYDQSKAASFLELSTASPYTLKALGEGVVVNRELYDDGQFGSWMSTYLPLKDSSGQVVAILGIDFEADYVREVQAAIKNRVVLAFGLAYGSLLILVYILSGIYTKPVVGLTKIAERIGEGDYNHDLNSFVQRRSPDEISILADVFAMMIGKVKKREETLKQQVAELKIEVDQIKRTKQVKEIVETDFFQDLQLKARKLRSRNENKSQPVEIPNIEPGSTLNT